VVVSMHRSRRLVAVTALASLLAFGLAWAETTFAHEDDGCVVEIHCLACRWAAGATAVIDAGLPLPVRLGFTEAVPPEAASSRDRRTHRLTTSRGPPSA